MAVCIFSENSFITQQLIYEPTLATYVIGGPSGGVVVGTNTVSFPSGIDAPSTIVTNGVTLTVGPSEPTSTDPVGDLERLKPPVGILAGTLGSIVAIGAALEAGTIADAAAIAQLSELVTPLAAGRYGFIAKESY